MTTVQKYKQNTPVFISLSPDRLDRQLKRSNSQDSQAISDRFWLAKHDNEYRTTYVHTQDKIALVGELFRWQRLYDPFQRAHA